MKNRKKKLLLGAAFLMAGMALMLTGYLLGGRSGICWDKNGVHTAEGITITKKGIVRNKDAVYRDEKVALEEFDSFELNLARANVEVLPADDWYLEYRLDSRRRLTERKVSEGVFRMMEEETAESMEDSSWTLQFLWGGPLGWSREEEDLYVKLYVPAEAVFSHTIVTVGYGDVKLGNLKAEELTVDIGGSLELESWKGRMASLRANGMKVSGSLKGTQSLRAEVPFGDAFIKRLSVPQAELDLEEGSLKLGLAQADTLFVNAAMRNVEVFLEEPERYDYCLHAKNGKVEAGQKVSAAAGMYLENHPENPLGHMEIQCETGDIFLGKYR